MAGARAHHFNKQPQSVMGNLEIASDGLPRDAAVVGYLTEAMRSARIAAEASRLMRTCLGHCTGMQSCAR